MLVSSSEGRCRDELVADILLRAADEEAIVAMVVDIGEDSNLLGRFTAMFKGVVRLCVGAWRIR